MKYFIADDIEKGCVYGYDHDYIPFDDRHTDPDDTIIFDSLEVAQEAAQEFKESGFPCFVVDDTGKEYRG